MKQTGLLLLLSAAAVWGQAAAEANAGYKTKEGRANVAATLDAPTRDVTQRPKDLVKALELKPGSTVVDLGTGTGYMLPHLSEAVGSSGKVIAEDIQQDFIDKAKAKADKDGLKNVSFVLGSETDPKLPATAADLVLVLDAYHHFDYPDKMLASIAKGLKPGGRLAVVEFYKRSGVNGRGDWALSHIRLDAPDAIKEIEANGFKFQWQREHIPGSQYIALFVKK